MALMFLMQLGCCDRHEITKYEDVVPELKSLQSMLKTLMLLICTTFFFIRFVVRCMMPTKRCRGAGTQHDAESSDNRIRINDKCMHLLWSGDMCHSRKHGLRNRLFRENQARDCQQIEGLRRICCEEIEQTRPARSE